MTLANFTCHFITCKSFEQATIRFILHSVNPPIERTCYLFKFLLQRHETDKLFFFYPFSVFLLLFIIDVVTAFSHWTWWSCKVLSVSSDTHGVTSLFLSPSSLTVREGHALRIYALRIYAISPDSTQVSQPIAGSELCTGKDVIPHWLPTSNKRVTSVRAGSKAPPSGGEPTVLDEFFPLWQWDVHYDYTPSPISLFLEYTFLYTEFETSSDWGNMFSYSKTKKIEKCNANSASQTCSVLQDAHSDGRDYTLHKEKRRVYLSHV